jgi:hypothetical protein
MTEKRIKEILESHRKWLKGEKDGKRANFRNADLSGISLQDADLAKADLRGANLFKADLRYSSLEGADLSEANLSEAKLFFSRLTGARLSQANLQGANLDDAFLDNADLSDADLGSALLRSIRGRYANFSKAILQKVDLLDADLTDANLTGADLSEVDFTLANLTRTKLDESEKIRRGIKLRKIMIGYKKCRYNVVVTLEIPVGAIVIGINKQKYRTNMAKVLGFDRDVEKAVSLYDDKIVYRKGEMVYPDMFDCEYNRECGNGIHFYRTKKEAEEYMKGE